MCGKTNGLFDFTKVTIIFLRVIDAQGFAVCHDPTGKAFVEWNDESTHGWLVYVRRNLKIKLTGCVIVKQDGGSLGPCDIRCRAHNIIQQGVEIQGGCQVARDFDYSEITIKGLSFDFSHGVLASLFRVM